ncbi:sensor histidine kinase [Planctomicrobium sp. SH668]|uniref:sensor histidine kinase n=1 Tax=Planctomicrobium sp. SH668 TaxID=3448126 RepID=UPI003F5B9597
MKSLTFVQRMLIAIGAVAGTCLITSPLLFWHWGLSLIIFSIDAIVAYSAFRWINSFVVEQHEYFITALRDLRNSLHTGKQSLLLKSDRPDDSFGEIAAELNDIVITTARQVSDQLSHNQDLEHNKTLFQSILGTMAEGVLVLDSERRILFFNRAARQLLGCKDRNVEGRPLWEVLRATELNAVIDAAFQLKSEFRKEAEIQRNKHIVEVTAAPLPISPAPGIVLVIHDITEIRSLERMRREFVSNVSHELKTPLTSIQAYADTLLDGGLSDEENNRTFVERILEQSDRLQELIQDMLRLARIESQADAFQLKPVHVADLLKSCVEARRAVAQSRQINLKLHVDETTNVQVMADASGLQTVFDNLVSNALNYTPQHGHVDVTCTVDLGHVIVDVMDDGIGIAQEHRDRIFERFYRIDKARSRSGGGNGLGLSIVKHLITVFNGEISLRSHPGQGSTFTVRLPVASNLIDPVIPEHYTDRTAP